MEEFNLYYFMFLLLGTALGLALGMNIGESKKNNLRRKYSAEDFDKEVHGIMEQCMHLKIKYSVTDKKDTLTGSNIGE